MTVARSRLVKNDVEGFYHCISRCVRRAYLCGKDPLTKRDYDHRKEWIRDRLKELAKIFFIDICNYAIMENHFHIVLRNRPDLSNKASRDEIAKRWWHLFPGPRDTQNQVEEPTPEELEKLVDGARREKELRERLSSLSWFMRCLKEVIARRANQEDDCTGHFWEGRFKSIALLDRAAILTCAAYVDLNPIRAGIADTPEESTYTSVQDRIVARQANKELNHCQVAHSKNIQATQNLKKKLDQDQWLCPLQTEGDRQGYLNIPVDRYLEILDWTGRRIKEGKKGRIPMHLAPILDRLEVNHEEWLNSCQHFGSLFYRAAGMVQNMRNIARDIDQKWVKGLCTAQSVFHSHTNPITELKTNKNINIPESKTA